MEKPIRLLGWLFLIWVVSACAAQQTGTPIPTQTLIPSTATPTATPTLPTITPQDLPAAQDFILTPSPVPLLPIIDTTIEFDKAIVKQTQADLASHLSMPLDQLQLVEVRSRLYYVEDCPTANFPTPPPLSHGIEVTWIADTQTHTYLTWDNVDFVWCQIDRLRGKYLVAIDPVAAELSALAIRRVSQQEEIPADAFTLVDVIPVQWQDSSLGCPQAGQTYANSQIDGYRIVIGVGETSFQFHTDSVQLVPCDTAN